MLLHKLVNALLLLQPRFTVGTSSLWLLHLSRKLLCAIFPVSFVLRTCCSPLSFIQRIYNSFLLMNKGFFVLPYLLFCTKIPHSPPVSSVTSSIFPSSSASMDLFITLLPVHQRPFCLLHSMWGSCASNFHLCLHLSLSLSCLWGQQSFEIWLGLTFLLCKKIILHRLAS